MKERPLVILASARKQGDTRTFLNHVFTDIEHDLIDLLDVQIAPYNYSDTYAEKDEFLNVMDELLQHKVIVFATPVYWYAMSGLMKNFFDRFTDVVTTKKHVGRQLNGKSTFLLAVGTDKELPIGFEIPFKRTSDYLDMVYRGCLYHSTKSPDPAGKLHENIRVYIDNIQRANR
jgi:multimeric flavodoxin WrbA